MSSLPPGYTGPVPIFPLPTLVLFPHTVVPLHIFEPRYRAMVGDALQGDRLIAMALLKPGWEKDYEGAPPVHDVVGVGRILHDERTEDGRFNILLEGIARARIEELIPPDPYRRARVRVLSEPVAPATPDLESVRLGLLAVYASLVGPGKPAPARLETSLSLGTICDLLAGILEVEIAEKQAILEELEPGARAKRTIEMIRRSPQAAGPVVSGLRKVMKSAWPPETTSN
ncbi:MAG TPA: LON peptidase substrate-binding domain-containing protein [Planctomycetota bacterium]|nr:LON peptidase substrate-binding domain-containing protein [Planctomycetota bacterium]